MADNTTSYKILMGGKTLLWTTKFEAEDNREVNETKTHSGTLITPGSPDTYSLKVEKATAYDATDEKETDDIIEKAKDEPTTLISIKQTATSKLTWTFTNVYVKKSKQEVDENGEISYNIELTAGTRDFDVEKLN